MKLARRLVKLQCERVRLRTPSGIILPYYLAHQNPAYYRYNIVEYRKRPLVGTLSFRASRDSINCGPFVGAAREYFEFVCLDTQKDSEFASDIHIRQYSALDNIDFFPVDKDTLL